MNSPDIDLLPLPGLVILTPRIFSDDRGSFMESYNAAQFTAAVGLKPDFVQDNHSYSRHKVLRGLHYQVRRPQGKLVRVLAGEIYDVAVDLRPDSTTWGQWVGIVLSAANRKQLWVPPGFAHGFQVLSETADVAYKTTDYWAPEYERCLAWNDPQLAIPWPHRDALLNPRDAAGTPLADAEPCV